MHRYLLLVFLLATTWGCQQETPTTSYSEDKKELPPRERFGDLFIDAQMAGVFPDGKTVVDCIPKYPTDQIMEAYEEARQEEDFDITSFWMAHFEEPPQYATGFASESSRTVSEHISVLWDVLTRQPDDQDAGTLIPLPNPYIVPGGRFREIYYWDSYFTMLGLIADDRTDMVENMVDNFAYLIDTIGFIPNGNRTYFLTRSQPPFFGLMVELLAKERGPDVFTTYLPQLEKEYQFWMNGLEDVSEQNPMVEHVVRMPDGAILNRYFDQGDYPREEMWKDDVEVAEASGRPEADIYADLRAACESGWDFSSRWFSDAETLMTVQTTSIIPVDLNSLLYQLERTIARAHRESGSEEEAAVYEDKAKLRAAALQLYCWNEEGGFFRDYQYTEQRFTPVRSLAGVYPLFVGIADTEQGARVAQTLREEFLFPGGLVSTPNETGQQWDAPNGWAPLQYMAIQGLRRTGQTELAQEIRDRWVQLNRRVYEDTGKLVEKYNVVDITLESGGGEYPVQDGFGWTNGVLQALIKE